MREILHPKSLPAPLYRYSPFIKTGPFYQSAGMVALDLDTGKLISGGVQAQASQILFNMQSALKDLGLRLEDLIACHIYTTKFEEFPAINAAWEEVFTRGVMPPARTSIGVSALPLGALVEMEFKIYKENHYNEA